MKQQKLASADPAAPFTQLLTRWNQWRTRKPSLNRKPQRLVGRPRPRFPSHLSKRTLPRNTILFWRNSNSVCRICRETNKRMMSPLTVSPPVRSNRRRSTESVSGTDSCSEQGDDPDHEKPPILPRQSPVEQEQSDENDNLPLIEQTRIVEFKDALTWVSSKTVFTTGKPWTDAQASDQPIRMACRDILQAPREHSKVALSPSPFLIQLSELRAPEVRKRTRASEAKHIAPSPKFAQWHTLWTKSSY